MNQSKTFSISHRWQLAGFILAHLFIFIVLFHTVYKMQYSATGLYFEFASRVLDGTLPYRDFALEYPPFSLLFFILPRLFASTWTTFSIYYQAEVIIFDLIGLFIIYSIARRSGQAPWPLLSIYTFGVIAMGPIIGQQYDIFPAVMSLLAIYLFWLGKHKTSWALLALGTLTKIFPAVIAPVFLIYYLRNRQFSLIWQGILTFGAVSLAVFLPFLIISPTSLLTLYDYHALRGIQLESIYSSVLLVANKLGFLSVTPAFSYGAWNLTGPDADILAKLSTYALGILLILSYWFIYRQTGKGKPGIMHIGSASMLVVAVILFASKVLSPQYIIWLIPLLPLVAGRWYSSIWVIFILVGVLTYYIFPLRYVELVYYLDYKAVAVLFFRNILLIAIAVLTAISLIKQPASQKE